MIPPLWTLSTSEGLCADYRDPVCGAEWYAVYLPSDAAMRPYPGERAA